MVDDCRGMFQLYFSINHNALVIKLIYLSKIVVTWWHKKACDFFQITRDQ